MAHKEHWERIYEKKADEEMSWFESFPAISLQMLVAAGMMQDSCVIDVGGGSSRLVDSLLERGLHCLTVRDVSGAALQRARARLGQVAAGVNWIESDITGGWSIEPVDFWHDRAVFHFLNSAEDRSGYKTQLLRTLKIRGVAIIATFAIDGPEMCSGLPVVRYSAGSLADAFRGDLRIIESVRHEHRTPWRKTQPLIYTSLRREG